MNKALVLSDYYLNVVDTESDTKTGAMTSIQIAPVLPYTKPYSIEREDATLIRCTTTKEGMEKFHSFLLSNYKEGDKIWLGCHNLKWDITFWLNYLMKDLNYKHKIINRSSLDRIPLNKEYYKKSSFLLNNEFDTLITDMGQVFTLKYKYKGRLITVQDTLKFIPFKLEDACKEKAYNTKFKKILGQDYDATLSDDYCLNDVLCLSELVAIQINEGLNPVKTVSLASWCLKDFKDKFYNSKLGIEYQIAHKDDKKLLNKSKCYRHYFPQLDDNTQYAKDTSEFNVPSLDTYIRLSYKGGLTYCNPSQAGKIFISEWYYNEHKDDDFMKEIISNGKYQIVPYLTHLDVHSLYPSKCLYGYKNYTSLPIGRPQLKKGAPPDILVNEVYNNKKHFVVRFKCRFNIKPNHFPSIQIKGSYVNSNEWIRTSAIKIGDKIYDQPLLLTLTDVEFFDFIDRYDAYDVNFIDYAVFNNVAQCKDIFECYMQYYYTLKSSTPKSNFVKYQSVKSKLNNLTGKFGSSVIAATKIPYIDEDGAIQLRTRDTDEKGDILLKNSEYVPIITFITAYGRLTLLDEMDKAGDNFNNGSIYITGDTDSVFVASKERFTPSLGITHSDLNTFDEEHTPADIAMLCATRAKTYFLLQSDGKAVLKVAGMTDKQKDKFCTSSHNPILDFSQDNIEVEGGKLIKKSTPDGAVLVDTDFNVDKKEFKPTVAMIDRTQTKQFIQTAPHTEADFLEKLLYDKDYRNFCKKQYDALKEAHNLSKDTLAKAIHLNIPMSSHMFCKVLRIKD